MKWLLIWLLYKVPVKIIGTLFKIHLEAISVCCTGLMIQLITTPYKGNKVANKTYQLTTKIMVKLFAAR